MPLDKIIRDRIREEGPMPVSTYMGLCLMHPEHGYYQSAEPFGERGDFLTAPEISQTFGEIIGLWLMQTWDDMGRPTPELIELGPGRGVLMRDILRTARALPEFLEQVDVHFIEKSERLRAFQAKAMLPLGRMARWSEILPASMDRVPFIIGNEFLDALPVVQYVHAGGSWRERLVGLKGKEFAFVASPGPVDPGLLPEWVHALAPEEGRVLEVSPAVDRVILDIASLILSHGGCALLIDYGYDRPGPGDTLQGVRAHKYADVLKSPGKVDLTAHVNCARITELAEGEGLKVFGPVGQGDWLKALGIETRAEALIRSAKAQGVSPATIARAVRRLIAPGEMGDLFKVIVLMHPDGPTPAPFVPEKTV